MIARRFLAAVCAAALGAALAGAAVAPAAQADEITDASVTVSSSKGTVGWWERFEITIDVAIPDAAKEGDTVTLTVGEDLSLIGKTNDILADDGTTTIATVTASGNALIYTFTDYVVGRTDVTTTLTHWVEINREKVERGQSAAVIVTVGSKTYPGPHVTVPGGLNYHSTPDSIFTWMQWRDPGTETELTWGTVLTPRSANATSITIVNSPGPGAAMVCDPQFAGGHEVELLVATSREHYLESEFMHPASVTCAPDRIEVTYHATVEAGNWVEVRGVIKVTDPSRFAYTNLGEAWVDSAPKLDSSAVEIRYGTTGFGSGVSHVAVGDLVWRDSNGNGRQDPGEPGIADVTLVLTGPDGKPVTDAANKTVDPAVTDEVGHYIFAGLPRLAAGQSYTVTVDTRVSSAALAGLTPTSPGVGDRAGDSSTRRATSQGLTAAGTADLTLDFGFRTVTGGPVPPVPATPGPTPEPTATPETPVPPVPTPGPTGTPGPMPTPSAPVAPDDSAEGVDPYGPGARTPGSAPGLPTPGASAPARPGSPGHAASATSPTDTRARARLARTGGIADGAATAGIAAILGGAAALGLRRRLDG